MSFLYLITAAPNSLCLGQVANQLQKDIAAGHNVEQIFFYSDAVGIGALETYPAAAQMLIEAADLHDIPLLLCSAAFQKRQLQLSYLTEQDFVFKGLGQLVSQFADSDMIRQF